VANAARAPQTARMPATRPSPSDPLRLDLEIAVGAEPIAGVLHAPDAEPRAFTGWLGLMATIDEMREARPAGFEPAASRSGGGRSIH
jgi:hypothetical protein